MAGVISKFWNRLTKPRNNPSGGYWFRSGNSSVYVSEETAMKVAAFYRGVIYISSSIAKLPWQVKDKDNNIQYDDRVQSILDIAPSEEMSAMDFRMICLQRALIKGNFYAEIVRDRIGRVISMYPINSKCVQLIRDVSNNLVYKVTGEYAPNGPVYIPPMNMFHYKGLHLTEDGLLGMGLEEWATSTLGITIAADSMASGLFENGGVPSGVLSMEGRLSDEAYKRLKDTWKENEKNGVQILEQGLKYTPIDVDLSVLQFLDSRKFGVVEIARFLGLPPTKLFDMSASTFNNVENANLEVATDTLAAHVAALESVADIKLLNYNHGRRKTEIDMGELTRGDMKTRSGYFKDLMSSAAITPNEIRLLEGRSPYEEGDEFMLATNNFTPMSMVRDVIQAQINKGKGNGNSAGDNSQSNLEKAAARFLEK